MEQHEKTYSTKKHNTSENAVFIDTLRCEN